MSLQSCALAAEVFLCSAAGLTPEEECCSAPVVRPVSREEVDAFLRAEHSPSYYMHPLRGAQTPCGIQWPRFLKHADRAEIEQQWPQGAAGDMVANKRDLLEEEEGHGVEGEKGEWVGAEAADTPARKSRLQDLKGGEHNVEKQEEKSGAQWGRSLLRCLLK
ncbi:uncharacterized protein LOC126474825 [Schistocerca serialis cubense]|uniref:uncharacterized protein LOC126474825 n=1 Tax=Schistocerca serialis cubense TaxID=2023355 RepID=UPI00214E1419|nr:uncharacterized protein LOC126474825 [Schistocerca serialis cubense]